MLQVLFPFWSWQLTKPWPRLQVVALVPNFSAISLQSFAPEGLLNGMAGEYWTKFTQNAEPFCSEGGTQRASHAKCREESSTSSPNSLSSGTCTAIGYLVTTVTLVIACLLKDDHNLKRPSHVASESFCSPWAVLREHCHKLWTTQCLERPSTYLTLLTFIRAVRWHEEYVYIGNYLH